MSSGKPRGLQFDSQSGHMVGLQAGARLGVFEGEPIKVSLAHRCLSPSFSPPLPLSLKINKYNLKKNSEVFKSQLKSWAFYSLDKVKGDFRIGELEDEINLWTLSPDF